MIAIAVAVVCGGVYWYLVKTKLAPVACTLEAKLCPDDSYVGRTGPSCEFASCNENALKDWQTFTDTALGVTFKYPATLPTKYIHPIDWPPKVAVANGPFSCKQGGSEIMLGGTTNPQIIDNKNYCVTKESEGAAGSIYTNYAYAFLENNKVVTLTITIRAVQCGNYSEPEATACETEQTTFDINNIVDEIAGALKLN